MGEEWHCGDSHGCPLGFGIPGPHSPLKPELIVPDKEGMDDISHQETQESDLSIAIITEPFQQVHSVTVLFWLLS